MDWRDKGACVGLDPELFFPVGSGDNATLQTARAKQVCQRCRVRQPCLEWALATGPEGVWGGLDEHERRQLRRVRLPAA